MNRAIVGTWGLLLCTCAVVAAPARARAQVADTTQAPAPAATMLLQPSNRHFWLPRASEGGWISQDKMLHASISYAGAFSLRASGASPGVSIGAVAGLGVLKELHDSLLRPGGAANQGASRKDLVADAFGIALAGLAMHLWLE